MSEMSDTDRMKSTRPMERPEPAKTSLSKIFTFSQQTLNRVTGFIELGFSIVDGLIGLRFLLKMIASNPDSPFANFIYAVSYPFVYPFIGLVRVINVQGMVIEFYDLVAMLVYILVAWVIIRLVWLTFAQVRS